MIQCLRQSLNLSQPTQRVPHPCRVRCDRVGGETLDPEMPRAAGVARAPSPAKLEINRTRESSGNSDENPDPDTMTPHLHKNVEMGQARSPRFRGKGMASAMPQSRKSDPGPAGNQRSDRAIRDSLDSPKSPP
jgi:hypothetical protein